MAIKKQIGKLERPCDRNGPREHNNINVPPRKKTGLISLPVSINGHRTMAMLDSGASGNFMSPTAVERLGIRTRRKAQPVELTAVDGSQLPGVDRETVSVPMILQQHHESIVFDIMPMARHGVIIGITWLRDHNPRIDWNTRVLTFECACMSDSRPPRGQRDSGDETREVYEIDASSNSKTDDLAITAATTTGKTSRATKPVKKDESHASIQIPKEYLPWKQLFEEVDDANALPEHTEADHEIKFVKDAKLPKGRVFPLSAQGAKIQKEMIDRNLKRGFIRKSNSSVSSPTFTVPKKGTTELREVTDYRLINAITVKDRYPLPNIQACLDRLVGSDWFTKMNLKEAFYNVRMKKGEEWKTAFCTQFGLFEWLVMPMGLTNAPATCQAVVNKTMHDLLDVTVIAYMDDILVFTKGQINQHIKDVQEVFRRLLKVGFRTRPHKCKFHVKETDFLGFIVSTTGVRMDPAKVSSISEWPTPKNLKEVQSFLGLANYNRKFIQGYSKVSAPLTELTKKDKPFKWEKAQQQAFEELKKLSTESPVLRTFDEKKTILMETDASGLAISAVLTQEHDGKRHPVAYFSKKMSPAEQNYDIHDKELLAIVAAFKHWRTYVEGAPEVKVYSDHKNLTRFTTTKELTPRQVRWAELLGQHKFTIIYTPGRENGRADALSRRADYMEEGDVVTHNILVRNKDGSLSSNNKELYAIIATLEDDDEEYPVKPKKKYIASEEQRKEIIMAHHDAPQFGHPGINKTLELVQRNYTWTRMRDTVSRYISKCNSCQKNKASRHAKYGSIQHRPPPEQPWEEVTMDFITKLPQSQDGLGNKFDTILVMVDRLTKYMHAVPCKETYTAENIGQLIHDRLIRYHGKPKVFITDRDKWFTSNYWRTFVAEMGIQHKLSTAFHPQTDGQTERANQTLEQYLRHYINQAHSDWVTLLPSAQIAINNQRSETTKHTPFYANFGKDPIVLQKPLPGINAQKALTTVRDMNKIHEEVRDKIIQANKSTLR